MPAPEAQQKGSHIAEEYGHQLKPWSNINSSHCEKCGRQARIRNILGRDNTEFKGPAFEQECDETTLYGSRDRWHWEFAAHME